MLDKETVMLIAVFAADCLVQTGAVKAPQNAEQANALIKACTMQFIAFMGQVAATKDGEGCDCDACPDAAHCPSKGLVN